MLSRNLTIKICIISLLVVCGCISLITEEKRRLDANPGMPYAQYKEMKKAVIRQNLYTSRHNSDTMHALERIILPYITNGFAKLYDFNGSDPRPVMNTFFSKRDSEDAVSNEDIKMLAVWKAAWSAAGWNPRVLNISHAKAHPNYTWAVKQLDHIPMWVNVPGVVDHYNRLCFLRHFSMGAVGGGWMSDYDSIPFNMDGSVYGSELPNEGNFTSYQNYVPALVVASKTEWDRFARSLIYEGLNTKEEQYSDMMAQLDLYNKGRIIDTPLFAGIEAINMPYNEGICDRFVNKTFIHFNHASVGGERAEVIIETLRQISELCNESFVDLTREQEAPVPMTSVM